MRPTRVLAAVVAAGLTGLLLGPPADASSALQSAYWWVGQPDQQTNGATVPAPPQVPAGGLYVASTSAGPSAVSAIRFTLSPRERNPVMVLRVHQLQQVDGLSINAYPTTVRWDTGDAQSWSTRPAYDAKQAPIKGVLNAGATTVTFDLANAPRDSTVDLVLVPGAVPTATTPAAPPSPTFDAAFEPVRPADIRTVASPTTPTTSQQPAPTPQPQSSGAAAAPSPQQGVLVPVLPASAAQNPPPAAGSAPVVAPPSAVPPPAASAAVRTGRSSRELFILAFLLADAMAFLAWRARAANVGSGDRAGRTSIYDLPPAPALEQKPAHP